MVEGEKKAGPLGRWLDRRQSEVNKRARAGTAKVFTTIAEGLTGLSAILESGQDFPLNRAFAKGFGEFVANHNPGQITDALHSSISQSLAHPSDLIPLGILTGATIVLEAVRRRVR